MRADEGQLRTWMIDGLDGDAAAHASLLRAQQAAPDLILSNGKIITVDERFSIAQAVAIRGDRIIAVGTSQDVGRLAGPNTRRIEFRGPRINRRPLQSGASTES